MEEGAEESEGKIERTSSIHTRKEGISDRQEKNKIDR